MRCRRRSSRMTARQCTLIAKGRPKSAPSALTAVAAGQARRNRPLAAGNEAHHDRTAPAGTGRTDQRGHRAPSPSRERHARMQPACAAARGPAPRSARAPSAYSSTSPPSARATGSTPPPGTPARAHPTADALPAARGSCPAEGTPRAPGPPRVRAATCRARAFRRRRQQPSRGPSGGPRPTCRREPTRLATAPCRGQNAGAGAP